MRKCWEGKDQGWGFLDICAAGGAGAGAGVEVEVEVEGGIITSGTAPGVAFGVAVAVVAIASF